jgi:ketosteroid isomerase-like protein
MSRENVEIVRAGLDAFNRGDRDAALKDVPPDFEFDMSRAISPDQRGVYGADQLGQLWDDTVEPSNPSDSRRRTSSRPVTK